jgi:hypothetical protein
MSGLSTDQPRFPASGKLPSTVVDLGLEKPFACLVGKGAQCNHARGQPAARSAIAVASSPICNVWSE